MPYNTLGDIPISYRSELFCLMQNGVIGWHKDATQSYHTHSYLHSQLQSFIQANSKNHRPQKMKPFQEIYPNHDLLLRLGRERPKHPLHHQMFHTFSQGAPQWLRDAYKKEIENDRRGDI